MATCDNDPQLPLTYEHRLYAGVHPKMIDDLGRSEGVQGFSLNETAVRALRSASKRLIMPVKRSISNGLSK